MIDIYELEKKAQGIAEQFVTDVVADTKGLSITAQAILLRAALQEIVAAVTMDREIGEETGLQLAERLKWITGKNAGEPLNPQAVDNAVAKLNETARALKSRGVLTAGEIGREEYLSDLQGAKSNLAHEINTLLTETGMQKWVRKIEKDGMQVDVAGIALKIRGISDALVKEVGQIRVSSGQKPLEPDLQREFQGAVVESLIAAVDKSVGSRLAERFEFKRLTGKNYGDLKPDRLACILDGKDPAIKPEQLLSQDPPAALREKYDGKATALMADVKRSVGEGYKRQGLAV